MKKFISLIMMALLSVSLLFTGCASTSVEGYDYTGSTDKVFQFKTFVGVPEMMDIYNANETSYYTKELTDEEVDAYYKDMKDAGFTVATPPYTVCSREHNLRMLDKAQKYGLKQLIGEMTNADGISMTNMLRGLGNDPKGKAYTEYTDAEIETLLTEFLAPYIEHEAFYGIVLWDEPSIAYYDNIARAKTIFDKVAPGKLLYVNLLPISASLDSLGVETNADRMKYATEYIDKIDLPYVSYDRYPLIEGNEGQTIIGEDFLYNMQVYRQAADSDPDGTRELWTYLQSTEHTFGTTHFVEPDSIAEFRWQVYSFLAFGGTGITWFTHFPPPPVDSSGTQFGVGPYDRKGRKTEIFYYIQQVQQEVHAFEKVYFNFDWESVITVMGEENEDGFVPSYTYLDEGFAAEGHERIRSYTCQQDTLIGCFKDADGADGFMITNYANPDSDKESRTQITFKNAKAAAVYRRGEKRIISLGKDGKFDMTLLPGEGIFVIPLA